MKNIIVLFITVLFINGCGNMSDDSLKIPAIFGDNMVLQQKTDVAVWGLGSPGNTIKVIGSWGEEAETIVNDSSQWKTFITTIEAGGPHTLMIEAGDTSVTYNNVLFGEVWLGSGQSNMEMPLRGWPPNDTIMNSANEIANALLPDIRLFTIQKAYSAVEEFNCSGSWLECSPETAADFSATAFFFGKKLYEEINVPIGLIHSSWGGTPVESWTSKSALKITDDFSEVIKKLESSKAALNKRENWIKSFPAIDVSGKDAANKWKDLDFKDSVCPNPDFSTAAWKTMNLPVLWEQDKLGNFDGAVWFRKTIEIPDNWVNKNLTLHLGPIDDMDVTYVNGNLVGSIEEDGYYQEDRVYEIHPNINTDNILTIAVRVMDTQGGGGIYGEPDEMKLTLKGSTSKIMLHGEWSYLPVAEYYSGKFYVFGVDNEPFNSRPDVEVELSAYTPSALYSGMISPIVPFTIKGVIWYQGEANTGRAKQYARLFPAMIEDWRSKWNIEFPFYYVQIAPYRYGEGTNSQELREAQLMTLSTPKTGMAVTMDIGNPDNIHPANKTDVGKRLALLALAKDYGKDLAYSGPVYKSMKIENGKAILSFEHANGGLMVNPINGENNFLIAGSNKKFVTAEVKVKGGELIVYSRSISKPVAVRYAWSDIQEGTLFNKSGLPSSSFRTDRW